MRERPLILTVGDNRSFLGKLAVLLERLHCDVLPANSARETFDLARVAHPRAIILNMQLTGLDGLEFLRNLRADEELADIPVVMITDVREKRQVWEAMSLGCIEVLDKPLDLDKLHQALQRCNLYPVARRRYLRAPYARPVEVLVDGTVQVVNALTLSERGIMVRMPQPLPRGTAVEVRLFLPDAQVLQAGGNVIYVHDHQGSPGESANVAIRFDRLTINSAESLQTMVRQLLVGDLVAGQGEEPIVKPD
jgi:CheY-like chemotaxis protein